MTIMERFSERLGDPTEAFERQQRMNADMDYLLANLETWRAKHPNRWVAIHDQRLIAVADTHEKITAAVNEKGLPLPEVVLDFISEEPVAYLL